MISERSPTWFFQLPQSLRMCNGQTVVFHLRKLPTITYDKI